MPIAIRATLLIALAPLLSACYDEPSADEGAVAVPAVEAVQARFGPLPLVERLSGVVKARNQVEIRSEIAARVVEVMARSGDTVERGQPLVRLDANAQGDQLRQAEASGRLAEAAGREAQARIVELEAQVRRSRVLVEEKLISDLELETQEAQLAAARAAADRAAAGVDEARATVEERETALDKTLVRAPLSGRVGQRAVEVGSLVDPGAVLFVIGDLDRLRIEVSLTEAMLGYIREDRPVLISADSLGEDPLAAMLSRISPFLAAGSFSTVGEIDVDNPEDRLRPGMLVSVNVLYGESAAAAQVPTSALWEDPRSGVRGLFVAQGGLAAGAGAPDGETSAAEGVERTVTFRPVEVVAEGRTATAVRGVEEGDWVVTVGQHLLRAGEPAPARVHATTWERVLALEDLERDDVLRAFLAKQRESARTLGARPPDKNQRAAEAGRSRVAPADGAAPVSPAPSTE